MFFTLQIYRAILSHFKPAACANSFKTLERDAKVSKCKVLAKLAGGVPFSPSYDVQCIVGIWFQWEFATALGRTVYIAKQQYPSEKQHDEQPSPKFRRG